jgi:hypothetical protein
MTPNITAIPEAHTSAAADEPQHGHAPRHQAGPVHQEAEQQPVADADDEARAEQERPVLDRHQ